MGKDSETEIPDDDWPYEQATELEFADLISVIAHYAYTDTQWQQLFCIIMDVALSESTEQ